MCGVVGYCGFNNAVEICLRCLQALQHRGQDSAGATVGRSGDPKFMKNRTGLGLVYGAINQGEAMASPGDISIGHVRYATAGRPDLRHAQPFQVYPPLLAHAANGDYPPKAYEKWREYLTEGGAGFLGKNDGELTTKLLAHYLRDGYDPVPAIARIMETVDASFASVMLCHGKLYAFRDPRGIRPLVVGKGRKGDFYIVASETCAFGAAKADLVQPVAPGEIWEFSPGKKPTVHRPKLEQTYSISQCIFELIYFSLPASVTFGISASAFREALGRRAAARFRHAADVVIGVPNSATHAALGFSQGSGIPFGMGLLRNPYTGRTFIEPTQEMRDAAVNEKYVADEAVIRGKRVVLVDDSIVRGTTTVKLVRLLRDVCGAAEVHVVISSPPYLHPCYYGIATQERPQLIAANKTVEETREHIGTDSLTYLDMDDLHTTVREFGQDPNAFCNACFTGRYPTPV